MRIGDLQVEVVKKNIKNIHLAVYPPHGKVRIAAPETVNDETLRLYTISKLAWIRKQQRRFTSQERQSERQYINRETHYFLGKKYLLKVVEDVRSAQVEIKGQRQIVLHVKPNATREYRQDQMNAWYRNQLKALLPELIAKWEKILGLHVAEWGVKHMKTKWGTCNPTARRIWFNLELAKKPVKCIEYIVVHEMMHFLVRTHNDDYVALMDRYLPDWKKWREELNELPVA
jgi:predicted metal-dependent hydrolase